MIVSFAGHSAISSKSKIKELVKEQLRNHIINAEPITCYLGGYGDFDEICTCACKELKQESINIELVYITPYLHLSEQAKMKEMQAYGLYDTTIYPPIENTPPRYAILKRNEWMMTNADIVIVYINHTYGGAYRSFQVAKRKKKKIINICDLLQ